MARCLIVAVLMVVSSVNTLRVVEQYPWYRVPKQVCLDMQEDLPRKPYCKCWQSMTPKDWEDTSVLKWICNGRDPNNVVKDQPSWPSYPPVYTIPSNPSATG
uniref:Alpha trans-inducing factor 78 kDa protein n=1 Tax=Lygus hesperus TaxID=30085 RepID=A0A0A9XKP6_LYGHE